MKIRKLPDGRYLICESNESNNFAITFKVIEKISEKFGGFTLRIDILENVDTITLPNLTHALLGCLKQSHTFPDFEGVKRFEFNLDGAQHTIDPTLHRD